MSINAKTQMCIIIGDPVGHSLSPTMHNRAYQHLHIADQFVFTASHVKPEDLATVIHAVRAMGIRGLTCTIPHKSAVMQYLDKIDPIAQQIGAVNTVVNDQGTLTGYNTDWLGIVTPLQKIITIKDKQVAIIGAGGAARGIAFAIVQKQGKICFYNRTLDKAQTLAKEFKARARGLDQLEQITEADIIINATSLGMKPHEDKSPIPSKYITKHHIVMDAVYKPLHTKLLKQAQQNQATIIPGLEMLLYQGTAQFELYTQHQAPEKIMRDVIYKHFGVNS